MASFKKISYNKINFKKIGETNMIKITFMGAGSTVFAKNVLGDCMLC